MWLHMDCFIRTPVQNHKILNLQSCKSSNLRSLTNRWIVSALFETLFLIYNAMTSLSTGGVHGVECNQWPSFWLPARQLQGALLLSAASLYSVWCSPLLAGFSSSLVPMAVLRPWRLVERLTLDGGAVRFRRHAHFCAAGTMCLVCRDFQPPSEQVKTCKVQPGKAFIFLLYAPKPTGWPSFSYHLPLISQVASLIGSSSVLFCGVLSKNMEDFAAFQAFTVMIAILSCVCMLYTGLHSESRFDNKGSESDAPGSVDQTSHQSAFSFSMLRTLTWQIVTNRDFRLFVLMNFFQVFILAFFNNFTMIFAEHLIPPDVLPSLAKSVMYGAGFICPQVMFPTGLGFFFKIKG